jgi:hypothetical protein
VIGQPLEDVTGLPKEFPAQLAAPFLGFYKVEGTAL